jgi:hypothetical protein
VARGRLLGGDVVVMKLKPSEWPFATDEERAEGWATPEFDRRRKRHVRPARPETVAAVREVIAADEDGFWLLVSDDYGQPDPRKRQALVTLIAEAWGKGYERGAR